MFPPQTTKYRINHPLSNPSPYSAPSHTHFQAPSPQSSTPFAKQTKQCRRRPRRRNIPARHTPQFCKTNSPPPPFCKTNPIVTNRHFANQTQVRSAPSPTGMHPPPIHPVLQNKPKCRQRPVDGTSQRAIPPHFAKRTHPWEPRAPARALPSFLPSPLFAKQTQSSPIRHFANQTQVRSAPSPTGMHPPPIHPVLQNKPKCRRRPRRRNIPARHTPQFCKTNSPPPFAIQTQSSSHRHFSNQTQLPELELGAPKFGAPRFCKTNPPPPPTSSLQPPPSTI